MSEWRDATLGDVLTLQRGFDLTERESTPGRVPVISSGGSNYTTDVAKVDGPGVITGRKGVLGKVHWSTGPYWPHDTTLWVKDFKGSDPRFVYYLLQTLRLADLDAGAANPTLNRNHAHLLPVRVPDPITQAAIAATLRSFDDLIENNRRRVAVLEEMARTIYREWFVKFRYPGHEDVPLVDTPLGPIPEGWKLSTLAAFADVTMGQSPKSEFYNDEGIGKPFHQGVTHFGPHFPSTRKWCSVGGRSAYAGDILISVRAPVGRINVADVDITIGRGLAAIRAKDGRQALLLGHLREAFAEEDSMGNDGAIFKSLGKTEMVAVPIIFPPDDVADAADTVLAENLDMIRALTHATQRLCALRDLLLPKLVTGQIDVSLLDLDALMRGDAS